MGSLSCDQFEPSGTRAFLQLLEPGVRCSRIFGLEFNVAQREGGLEFQAKQTQVTCLREYLLSGLPGSAEVLLGRGDVCLIKYHRDSNCYILAFFGKSNRFSNGCTHKGVNSVGLVIQPGIYFRGRRDREFLCLREL